MPLDASAQNRPTEASDERPLLSVIIPTLNEARALPRLLKQLARQDGLRFECLVADGGSEDASVRIASEHGARVVTSPAGRALQMNAAARQANAPYLLFLHADSSLPDRRLLRNAVQDLRSRIFRRGNQRIAGHFALRFQRRNLEKNRLAWRYAEEKSALNRRYTTNGDQGFMLHRDYFFALGSFDEDLHFLEDLRLAQRVHDTGRWITLPGVLETSARRFEREGFHARYNLMAIIVAAHEAGAHSFFKASPEIYRQQADTQRILLTPYLRLLMRITRELGWREALRSWLRVGRFCRHNWWQAFLLLDVMARPVLGPGRYPAVWLHDRLFAPLLNNRMGDALTAIIAYCYMMIGVRLIFRLREARALAE